MNYKINLEITNEDEEVLISDSTFVSTEDITSAEDSFYRLLRNFEKQLKKEKLIAEEAEQDLLDEVVDKEIKEIKEEK